MFYLIIGLRNVLKHRRRSFFTAFAVGAGFSAISLFSGYTHYVYFGLMLQAVRGEGLGHITIARQGFFNHASLNPADYLISQKDVARIGRLLEQQPETVTWTPRLEVSGMISNGKASTIFVGEGQDPAREKIIRGQFRLDRGGILDSNQPSSIAIASGLAKLLNLTTASRAVLFTNTADGMANAVDTQVEGTYDTGTAATNDKYLRMPIDLARKLYDVDGADRIRLLLQNEGQVDAVKARLPGLFRQQGLALDIEDWKQLSTFYRQVKSLFDTIFSFIFSIVVIVVVMSVVNTMSMAVMERTREIGTLRALGMRRGQIIRLFCVEATILSAVGVIIGTGVTLIAAFILNATGITYVPPSSSDRVPLQVDILPVTMALTFLLLGVLTAAAAILPARQASHQGIVDALGHV